MYSMHFGQFMSLSHTMQSGLKNRMICPLHRKPVLSM